MPPRGGRPALVELRKALGAGVAPDGVIAATSLADGMRRIGRLARGHSLVVVVSDFREDARGETAATHGGQYAARGGEYAARGGEYAARGGEYAARGGEYAARGGEFAARGAGDRPDWARALAGLASRHEVLAVEVVDPREAELPGRRPPHARWIPRRAGAWRPTRRARSCAAGSPRPSSSGGIS